MTSIYTDDKGTVFARIDLNGHEYFIVAVTAFSEAFYVLAEHTAKGISAPLAEIRPPKESLGGAFEKIDVVKGFCDFLFRHHFLMDKLGDDYLKN